MEGVDVFFGWLLLSANWMGLCLIVSRALVHDSENEALAAVKAQRDLLKVELEASNQALKQATKWVERQQEVVAECVDVTRQTYALCEKVVKRYEPAAHKAFVASVDKAMASRAEQLQEEGQ